MYRFHGLSGATTSNFRGYQRRPGYLGDLSDTWFGDTTDDEADEAGGAGGPVVNKYYVSARRMSDANAAYRSGVRFRPTIY